MFSATAQRALVARVRGDNRSLDAELSYQERTQKEAPGTLAVTDHGCSGHEHLAGDTDRTTPDAAAAAATPSTWRTPTPDLSVRSTT